MLALMVYLAEDGGSAIAGFAVVSGIVYLFT